MEMRKTGNLASAILCAAGLAALVGCSGHEKQSPPTIFNVTAAAQDTIGGTTYPVATVGSQVTITGASFENVLVVSFGGYQATWFHVDSGTQITAQVPENATSGYPAISNTGGTSILRNQIPPLLIQPEIQAFNPSSATPGQVVTVTGVGFYGTGMKPDGTVVGPAAIVTFTTSAGTTDVTSSYIDPNTLTVIVPANAAPGPVVLSVNGLQAAAWAAAADASTPGNLVFSAANS